MNFSSGPLITQGLFTNSRHRGQAGIDQPRSSHREWLAMGQVANKHMQEATGKCNDIWYDMMRTGLYGVHLLRSPVSSVRVGQCLHQLNPPLRAYRHPQDAHRHPSGILPVSIPSQKWILLWTTLFTSLWIHITFEIRLGCPSEIAMLQLVCRLVG